MTTEPSPLAPPASAEPVLTLTAPEPPKPVAATSAPKVAPAVPAAALPGLDQKVDAYLQPAGHRRQLPRFLPPGRRRPHHGRRGDPSRRRDASNRMLQTPVKALQEGGLSQGSKIGGTLVELRRTVEGLDPKGALQGGRKLLGMIPFGDRPDGLLPAGTRARRGT